MTFKNKCKDYFITEQDSKANYIALTAARKTITELN